MSSVTVSVTDVLGDTWVSKDDILESITDIINKDGMDADDEQALAWLCEFIHEIGDYEEAIHEGYIGEYFRNMIEDCYSDFKDLPSFIVIDWDATIENLLQDYSSIDIDGETYYIR